MRIVSSQPNSDISNPREAPPSRIRPLSVLPVFFKLDGRKAIVVGGSAAAAWKAELLAAAGADVAAFAESLSEEFSALLDAQRQVGRISHFGGRWTAADFRGAAIIVADAEDECEASRIVCAAREACVPVNVIDRPAFCDFQFGSIVNRSPAIVAISTDGAAPILGQAIRRRIETLLPAYLADWAAIAGAIREAVTARLKPGAERRRFWEAFSERAFSAPPSPNEQVRPDLAVSPLGPSGEGRVTLVGAGPGDAELLTIKAVRVLQGADVILFDDLVSTDVLELARREAKRMLVGKRGGRESCRQEDINAMMVSLARAGKHVVRLKSGDPMIFGRAGEEIAELQRHGIPVEVVPGVTSALAMASSLGISLTHRDCAQSVRFVTGHSRKGELPADIDWKAIADPHATTIFYMGGRTAAAISSSLIAKGLSPRTPVAVAKAISRPEEVRWTGTLAAMPAAMAQIGFDQPVLIGVGGVFATGKGVNEATWQRTGQGTSSSDSGRLLAAIR